MVADWHTLRSQGAEVRMIATEHAVVDQLNLLARHTLTQAGELPRKGRRYVADDHTRDLTVAVGERVRLGRNVYGLAQPDGTTATLRNGMEGTVTNTTRKGVTVQLDPDHRPGHDHAGEVVLPAGYVGEHLSYGYAITADSAQGSTVDHSLFAPSAVTTAERAYVALSRGRESNRVYAVTDSGWEEALAADRPHTLALHQHPYPDAAPALERDRVTTSQPLHSAAASERADTEVAEHRDSFTAAQEERDNGPELSLGPPSLAM